MSAVSRTTLYNRRQSVATLQDLAMPGFAVTYDPDLRFVVMSMKDGKTYKFGRYEVVHAWLDGYSRGVLSEDDET